MLRIKYYPEEKGGQGSFFYHKNIPYLYGIESEIQKMFYILSQSFPYLNGLGCRIKAKCPLVEPEPVGKVSSVGLFQRDPISYLSEFRRKPWKILNG